MTLCYGVIAQRKESRHVFDYQRDTVKPSITCDGWSSLSKIPHVGVTFHTINKDFKVVAIPLAMPRFPHPHTAEKVSEKVANILSDNKLDLNTNIWAITTDNASNYWAAMDDVNINAQFGCWAHTGQLAVNQFFEAKAGFEQAKPMATWMEHAAAITSTMNASTVRIQKLAERQRAQGRRELRPIPTVENRWNLRTLQLDRVMELLPDIAALSRTDLNMTSAEKLVSSIMR